jgi:CBS domain-containing protein
MKNTIINRRPLVIRGDSSITETIRLMISKKISSVLIINDLRDIVGIVTERDILRKISTLDIDIKLARPIRTIMARPVKFVYEESLLNDIKMLHQNFHCRHFPVLKDKDSHPNLDNLVGIVSTTDIFRYTLNSLE